jgi:hypothetical protein
MTYTDAVDILLEETPTDYIMEHDETPDFFQFRVSCGGDACTYRIYKKDGSIYEK